MGRIRIWTTGFEAMFRIRIFLRLDPQNQGEFTLLTRPELKGGCSVVRELHVYGSVVPVAARDPSKFQHQVRYSKERESLRVLPLKTNWVSATFLLGMYQISNWPDIRILNLTFDRISGKISGLSLLITLALLYSNYVLIAMLCVL